MGCWGCLPLRSPSRPFASPRTLRAGGATIPSAEPGSLWGQGAGGVGTPEVPTWPSSSQGSRPPGHGEPCTVPRSSWAGLCGPRHPPRVRARRNGGLRFPSLLGWSLGPLAPSEHDGAGRGRWDIKVPSPRTNWRDGSLQADPRGPHGRARGAGLHPGTCPCPTAPSALPVASACAEARQWGLGGSPRPPPDHPALSASLCTPWAHPASSTQAHPVNPALHGCLGLPWALPAHPRLPKTP